jgi:hypothetical protein
MSSFETLDIDARSRLSHSRELSRALVVLPLLTPFRTRRPLSWFNRHEDIGAVTAGRSRYGGHAGNLK